MNQLNFIYSKLFIVLLFAGIFVGCESLDEDLTGQVTAGAFFTDETSINSGMIGVYREASDVWGITQFSIPVCGDDILTTRDGANKQPFRDYDQFKANGVQTWEYQHIWKRCYLSIRTSNSYISTLENINPNFGIEESFINQKLGEARFLRANVYFALVKVFGDVPYFENAELKDSTTRKMDKRVIYDQMIKDLEFAEMYCVEESAKEAPGQVTKMAAKGSLAQIYMQLTGWPYNESDKWEKVKKYAGEVINSGNFELMPEYGDLFKHTKAAANKEDIFKFTFGLASTGAYQRFSGKPMDAWNDMHCQWKFYNDFPVGARKSFSLQANMLMGPYKNFVHPGFSKFLFGTIKKDPQGLNDGEWEEAYEHTWQTSVNIALQRLSDIYLLWAEADARTTGSISAEAVDYVNMVKRRAKGDVNGIGGNFYTTSIDGVDVAASDFASTNDFLNEIFNERGWEFAGEWGFRWFDLVRLEKLGEVTAQRNSYDLDAAIAVALKAWKAKNANATQDEINAQITAMKFLASELPLADSNPTVAKYGFAPIPEIAIQETPGLRDAALTSFED